MFFIFLFFFFRRDSSNLCDSRFFPGLKSHEAIRTAHWRTMALFTTPFFSSCITYQQNIIVTQDRQSRNTVGVRECLKPVIIQPMFLCLLLSCLTLQLKRRHQYYVQVQGQMAITERKWCDFIVYTTKGISVERVLFDPDFWNNGLQPSYQICMITVFVWLLCPQFTYQCMI